jgi:hypothetical protein
VTPLNWARRIAIHYRATLHRIAPHECARLDAQARASGQHWLLPTEIPEEADITATLDAELTARDIEHLWGIPASTIRTWANRGLIEKRCAPDGGGVVYRIGDVLAARVDKPNVS